MSGSDHNFASDAHTDIGRKSPRSPVNNLCRHIQLLLRTWREIAFPQARHPFKTVSDDSQNRFVDSCSISVTDRIPDTAVACVSCCIKGPGGLDNLIRNFSGNLEHKVEK